MIVQVWPSQWNWALDYAWNNDLNNVKRKGQYKAWPSGALCMKNQDEVAISTFEAHQLLQIIVKKKRQSKVWSSG